MDIDLSMQSMNVKYMNLPQNNPPVRRTFDYSHSKQIIYKIQRNFHIKGDKIIKES